MEMSPMKTMLAIVALLVAIAPCAFADARWFISAADRRIPIAVSAVGTARLNKPIETPIDFGKDLAFNASSLRLVEVSETGELLDDAAPVQFDGISQDRGQRSASGTLTFILQGKTAADTVRRYQLYYCANAGRPFTAPQTPPSVQVSEVKILDGQMPCFK